MKNILGIIIGLLFLLSITQCKKEVDLCANQKPFEADFDIKEVVGDSSFVTDTTLAQQFVIFEAKEDYDTYEWKIGLDERTFTTKDVQLFFPEPTLLLNIRLIATKKPSACFPNDKTVDTIVKTLKVVPFEQSKLIGEYQGADIDNPNEPYTVKIFAGDLRNDGYIDYVLDNWVRGCLAGKDVDGFYNSTFSAGQLGYQNAYMNKQYVTSCLCRGYLSVSEDGQELTAYGEKEITYYPNNPPGKRLIGKPTTFKGRRK
ncbi:MAG: hypothetical protein SFU27_08190 [Thermonemataceae bacterium]|nr:hypothetical protein [Thermonemataceae bacterium]